MTNTTSLYVRLATKFKIKKKFYEMHIIIHVLIYLLCCLDCWLLIYDLYNVYITMVCHANISKLFIS